MHLFCCSLSSHQLHDVCRHLKVLRKKTSKTALRFGKKRWDWIQKGCNGTHLIVALDMQSKKKKSCKSCQKSCAAIKYQLVNLILWFQFISSPLALVVFQASCGSNKSVLKSLQTWLSLEIEIWDFERDPKWLLLILLEKQWVIHHLLQGRVDKFVFLKKYFSSFKLIRVALIF